MKSEAVENQIVEDRDAFDPVGSCRPSGSVAIVFSS